MALDADVETYLDARRRNAPRASSSPLDAVSMRKEEAVLRGRYGQGPLMAVVEDHEIAVENGSIDVRLLLPTDDPDAVILFCHGGGWVVGEIDDYDAVARALAKDSNCAVALVNYRKAPEHLHPTALNDALAAAAWVESEMTRRHGHRLRFIVAGDSAGGNLAAVIAQHAGKGATPSVDLQVLIYPVLDSNLDTASYRDPSNDLLLTRELMHWFWEQYVPNPADRSSVTASPAQARSLRGLPQAIVLAAEHDVLRDECDSYVQRLKAEEVPVAYRIFSGQMHGFFSLHNVLPASSHARAWLAKEIQKALTGFSATTELEGFINNDS